MSKQVPWDRHIMDVFIREAMLSPEEVFIMENRVKNKPISWMASELSMSESSIHRMIARLKIKYDNVQSKHPEDMPPRKFSAKETWMDSH